MSAPASSQLHTVLLVEDEPQVRRFAAMALRRLGYAVTEVTEGQDALDLLAIRLSHFDLILMDVVMPGQSGPETLLKIRQRLPTIPVILMTGLCLASESNVSGKDPHLFHLAKPFQLSQLKKLIEQIISSPV